MIRKLVVVALLGALVSGCSKTYSRSPVSCGFVADYAAVAMSQAIPKMSNTALKQVTRGFVIQNDPGFQASEAKNAFLLEAVDIVKENRAMFDGVPLVAVKMYAYAICMGRKNTIN